MKYLIAISVMCGLAACSRVNETNVVQSYEWFHSANTQIQAKQHQIASFRALKSTDQTTIDLEGGASLWRSCKSRRKNFAVGR